MVSTVREDYGSGDDTWSYFSHERLGLWNGRDPILIERLFGLTNSEGNHAEDVKECYFYLDAASASSCRGAITSAAAGRRTGAVR